MTIAVNLKRIWRFSKTPPDTSFVCSPRNPPFGGASYWVCLGLVSNWPRDDRAALKKSKAAAEITRIWICAMICFALVIYGLSTACISYILLPRVTWFSYHGFQLTFAHSLLVASKEPFFLTSLMCEDSVKPRWIYQGALVSLHMKKDIRPERIPISLIPWLYSILTFFIRPFANEMHLHNKQDLFHTWFFTATSRAKSGLL